MANKKTQILNAPLTKEQIKAMADRNGYISGVIKVELHEIIHMDFDFEQFLDMLSEQLTGTIMLCDINYNLAGHDGNTMYLQVRGDASEIISQNAQEETVEECANSGCDTCRIYLIEKPANTTTLTSEIHE